MFNRRRCCCQKKQTQSQKASDKAMSQEEGAGEKPFPITSAEERTTVRLYKIEGGCQLKRRLTVLGFLENEPIRLIKKSYFGPVVIEIKGSKFAIGRGEAQKILVVHL